ncbi:phage tail protein [Avibacterium avium]|uniref:phage tail-collar fiber domain-containing protein n=1 Tax=Avibacterium avium TaxID=751 RepID=UPI003BF8A34F
MAKQYYSVLTDYGTQMIASAIARKQPLQITQMAVGDGNGRATTPNSRNTGLVREVHRANISAISVDPRNNKQLIFELTIPENVGGFWIREMGIFDNQNRLVAYANCPDSFKPELTSGSGKVQVVRMILLVSSSDAVTLKVDDSVIFVTRGQLTPKKITATTKNAVDETGHSHEIDKASTTQAGIVQLTSDTNSDSETLGLTAKAGKTLKALIDALTRNLANYIPNSKKSDATDSNSSDNVATSKAVKKAYDRAVEAEGKGLPVGAVLAFPRAITHPQGFLLADGSTFGRSTYPDLYRALGNSDKLPDLRRSDIGMTAYFATDNIPDGWVAFDDIRTQVTQERYPELYRYLTAKYGSIAAVPLAEDRFVRNAGAGLNVGQTQADELKRHKHQLGANVVTETGSGYAGGIASSGNIYITETQDFGGDETRPKSLVLKLCIKAQNTFDDVRFWIKAFGEVSNAGELDASRLAQDLQGKANLTHTHTASQITDFDTGVDNRIVQLFTYQKIGNFEVRKYPDGTMIQTCFDTQASKRSSSNQLFYLTLPVAFVGKPVVNVTIEDNATLNTARDDTFVSLKQISNSQIKYGILDMGNLYQTVECVHIIAIGRWK